MSTVLVTGGAGYIGSHACKRLSVEGFEPVVFDNLEHGYREFVKWGDLVVGDLQDKQLLEDTIDKYKPVAVLHFAAYAYVGESVTDPLKYYRNNFYGTMSLLETMKSAGVKYLVFSSTCASYGNPQESSISETHNQNPINPYGKSKYFVENMISDLAAVTDLTSVFLRYFNAAGCDFDLDCGEDHEPETHLIPLLLEVAGGEREVITVFGKDYPTSDGTCIRDYIHVDDLAIAHVQALEFMLNGNGSEVFNLGNGKGFSVLEVINSVERVTGEEIPIVFGSRREGDPPSLVADSTKATSVLNWKPKYKELDKIIESAWRWYNYRRGRA